MSWIFVQEHACISFDRVVSEEDLSGMLAELATGIIQNNVDTGECPDHLEDIFYDFKEGNIDTKSASGQIVDAAFMYLDQINHSEKGTDLLVRTNNDEEYYDSTFAQEIAKHLFSKTSMPCFNWRSTTFDKSGGSSDLWIGFWENDQIELIHTDNYFAKQFAVSVLE